MGIILLRIYDNKETLNTLGLIAACCKSDFCCMNEWRHRKSYRTNQSISQKKTWSDPKKRLRHSQKSKSMWADPVYKAKTIEAIRRKTSTTGFSESSTRTNKRRWKNVEFRNRIIQSIRETENRPKWKSEQRKRSLWLFRNRPELRQQGSIYSKNLWENQAYQRKQRQWKRPKPTQEPGYETPRHRNARLALDYLHNHPCVDCGEGDPVVLEFHHIRGVKKANVARLLRSSSWETVLKEVKKCVVVCSNCHTRRTAASCGNWMKFQLLKEV